MTRLAIATALVAAAAAPSFAQPSETPAADPTTAPQNADWTQVSHINGQLVPVGQKNDYFYQYKHTIVSVDPVGWILGMYGVSASYGLDDHIAIRGELDYISPPNSDIDTNTIEADVGVPIYFRRTYQGAFLEPGLVVRQTRTTYSSYDANATTMTDTTTEYGPQVLVGWHWTWESGLNIAVAAGVGRNLNYKNDGSGSGEQYIPNGYLRFGYAF